jgi:hypothetical protein
MSGTELSPKTWTERLIGQPTDQDGSSSAWRSWLILFFGFGLFARVIRYYLCFPLWDDESFLCVNFIHRNFAELMQPLDYHQVAPVLFLWIERATVLLFGFSEYTLRLIPFVCSILSLFLFVRVARQLLSGPALMFAVAMFAVSYPGIRCTDMFVSLAMLSVVLRWQKVRGIRELLLLTLVMPFALGVSYPAVFAAGGLSLVVGGILWWQNGTNREWISWSGWNVAIVSSFALWFLVIGQTQSSAEGEFIGSSTSHQFRIPCSYRFGF